MPRRWTRKPLVRRKSDGSLYAVHHGGFAESIRALFCDDRKFWFIPVRRWRGRLVAAIDLPWHPGFREFDVVGGHEERVLCVGRRAALPIDEGGVSLRP